MNRLYTMTFFLMLSSLTWAQKAWIKQMESDNANYFKAIKKFDKYWSHRFVPNEEEEHESIAKQKDPRRLITKLLQSEEAAQEHSNELTMAYKKFLKWKMEVLPYVQENGEIMNAEQRVNLWNECKNMNSN